MTESAADTEPNTRGVGPVRIVCSIAASLSLWLAPSCRTEQSAAGPAGQAEREHWAAQRHSSEAWTFVEGSQITDFAARLDAIEPGSGFELRLKCRPAEQGARRLRVGLLPGHRQAAMRIPGSGRALPAWEKQDERELWVETDCSSHTTLELQVPASWRATTGVVVAELHKAAGFWAELWASSRDTAIALELGPSYDPRLALEFRHASSTHHRALLGLFARTPIEWANYFGDAPTIDGVLDESEIWRGPGIEMVDSRTGEPALGGPAGPRGLPPGRGATRVWWSWDESNLYFAARLDDHDIWATHSSHDDPLYKQEAFEIFVGSHDPRGPYVEFQVSAANVTFDAAFRTHRRGGKEWNPAWQTAVVADGTLNARADDDAGWTVEMAIPWSELCERVEDLCHPEPGRMLRFNGFRLEKPRRRSSIGSALAPTAVPDFHALQYAALMRLEGRRSQ